MRRDLAVQLALRREDARAVVGRAVALRLEVGGAPRVPRVVLGAQVKVALRVDELHPAIEVADVVGVPEMTDKVSENCAELH